jgi:hypothetical protein
MYRIYTGLFFHTLSPVLLSNTACCWVALLTHVQIVANCLQIECAEMMHPSPYIIIIYIQYMSLRKPSATIIIISHTLTNLCDIKQTL